MDKTETLADCPFCGGAMMFRKALWPSDGCTDAVIHAEPTDCGMAAFDTGKTDESVITTWNTRTPRPDNALADELASELYKEHASFLRDKDARDWDELPEAIKTGWMNEAHKRLEPVLRYISPAALRPTPPEADLRAVDLLREAATVFVAKLDECQPYIDSAFFQVANHGMPHTGPQYGEELKALRAALKEAKDG